MQTDFINALTTLPIISEEEARKHYKGYDSIHEYDNPEKVASVIPKTHSGGGEICIYWAERSGKTEFTHSIYRTGESKWIYVELMEFLD